MLERELTVAVAAARAAGEVARRWYGHDCTVARKGPDSPVTRADLEADECIKAILCDAFPEDGWLSEETRDSPERLRRRRVWVVDPIDGTIEFENRTAEFAVAIGLVDGNAAVLGVTYNPITDELCAGATGRGVTLNDTAVRVSRTSDLGAASVLTSRTETRHGEWEEFAAELRLRVTGSVAYKLALIAAGRADATFSLRPKNEWDICAGVALVTAAGGRIADRYGAALRFNQPTPRFPGIIACTPPLFEPLLALLRAHGHLPRR